MTIIDDPHHCSMTATQTIPTMLMAEEAALKAKLPLKAAIFLPTDAVPLEQRVAGLRRVLRIYEKDWPERYSPMLRSLREQCAGGGADRRRCFVIGNGPSLNRTDLTLLRNEVTFGVNGLFLKFDDLGFMPTFYVVEDHLVAEDRADRINALPGPPAGPTKLFPINLAYCLDEGPDTIFFNHRPRVSYPHGFDFSTDASAITYAGCTVTFTCLQLAFYFGFREIYLVGVDADYSIPPSTTKSNEYGVAVLDMPENDPNHFHPDYFGKGYRWHDPQVDKMIAAYAEARRVTEAHGVRIVNATVGGKLEVFDRVNYASLFSGSAVASVAERPTFPRALILDPSRVGAESATGQLKGTLFAGWPGNCLMQVYSAGPSALRVHQHGSIDGGRSRDAAEVLARCREFRPDVIYCRPVSESPMLSDLAVRAVGQLGLPVVTHMMDDWPERLRARDPVRHEAVDAMLRRLFERSAVRLSICEAMSAEYEQRYGCSFMPVANGVDPEVWRGLDKCRKSRGSAVESWVLRYVGALADDMCFDSVCDVARAVHGLAATRPVRMEIHTTAMWKPKAEAAARRLKSVSVHDAGVPERQYRELLMGCDALLVAYNFDDESVRYVRLSMANKLPECLATGVPVLAYGPNGVATIDYAAATQAALVVTEQSDSSLRAALTRLVEDVEFSRSIGERGRRFAFEQCDITATRERFHSALRQAAQSHGWSASSAPSAADDAGLLGIYPIESKARLHEMGIVAEFLAASGGSSLVDGGLRIVYAPGFADIGALSDQCVRMLWYLHPIISEIGSIDVATTFELPVEITPPPYLDGSVGKFSPAFVGKVQRFDAHDVAAWEERLEAAHVILLWDDPSAAPDAIATIIRSAAARLRTYRVDRLRERHEGSFYLRVSASESSDSDRLLKESQQKFLDAVSSVGRHRKVYIFGTGPSLEMATGMDFSDGITIACNSMVKNRVLMDRLQPRLIAMGDPIFHAGASSYAAAFRRHLLEAMDRFDAPIVVPFRDYLVYARNLPTRYADRIIGVPLVKRGEVNLDLLRDFSVTSTANVLTLLLLPLAATLATEEIAIGGCDGRKTEDNAYFWSHHRASQIGEEMDSIRTAHPAFFAIDYDDYYLDHMRLLEQWIDAAERTGLHISSVTPSHIPCLAQRQVVPKDMPAGGVRRDERASNAGAVGHRVFVSITPDLKDNFGHFLQYECVLHKTFRNAGLRLLSLGHKDSGNLQAEFDVRPTFTDPAYKLHVANDGQHERRERFLRELEAAHDRILEESPAPSDICYFMYLCSSSALDALLIFAERHPHVRLHLNLFFLVLERLPLTTEIRRRFAAQFARAALLGNIALYADTPELAQCMTAETGWDIRPWPMFACTEYTAEDISSLAPHPLRHPPQVVCASNMNISKGYDLFLRLVLNSSSLVQRQCEFTFREVVQPNTAPWMVQLARSAASHAKVVQGALDSEAYRQFVANADIIVLPYRKADFAMRTSAALADAILFGKPVVTTRGTWLASHVQRLGIGELFDDGDLADMGRAIDRAIERHEDHQKALLASRLQWIEEHSPERLLSVFQETEALTAIAAPCILGPFGRVDSVGLSEGAVVREILTARGAESVMLDVGAHHGSELAPFLHRGWTVHAFEPDPVNRASLEARFGANSRITIDPRAVSDCHAEAVAFFASDESSGISSLTPFRETHRQTCTVATTTIADVVRERGISRIDLLKIDTEGYDLMVLKGVPWETLQPDVIVCEFEDRKTRLLGYSFHDLAQYLVDRGYHVLVSEWHPIVRYGQRHDWRRLVPYPCHLGSDDAWGNIIAFRTMPPLDRVREAATAALRYERAPSDVIPAKPIPARATFSWRERLVDYLDARHPRVAATARRVLNALRRHAHRMPRVAAVSRKVIDSAGRNAEAGWRRWRSMRSRVNNVAERAVGSLARRNGTLHAVLRFGLWSVRRVRHKFFGPVGALVLGAAALLALAVLVETARWLLVIAAGVLLSLLFLGLAVGCAREFTDRVLRDIRASAKAAADTRTEVAAFSARQEKVDCKLADINTRQTELMQRVDAAETRLADFVSEQAALLCRFDADRQQASESANRRIDAEMNAREAVFEKLGGVNAPLFQTFRRRLRSEDIVLLRDQWLPRLGLELPARSLGYMAHRICLAEERCIGRMAASVEDVLLRILVAHSISEPVLEAMEIGTLFGVSVAAMHELCRGRFDRTRITVIDPLDGYYGSDRFDLLTNVPVTLDIFQSNMRRMDVPDDDVRIIRHFSTDPTALSAAAEQSYNLLVIDGDHSCEGVRNDFTRFGPLVRKGGYVIFDDYNRPDWPDVQRFVDEFVMGRPELEFIGAQWHTAVFRVKTALAATPPDPA